MFPGVYVFNEKKHLKPVFFPKEVQIPGPPDTEDGDEEYLLVHGSNDPSTFRPELLPLDIAKVALVLVPTSVSIPELFRQGPNKHITPFCHADVLPFAPGFAAALPSQTEQYLLMALPVSIPILYGVDSTVRGPVNEGHVDCFENSLAGSSWWLDHLPNWSLPVQQAAFAEREAFKGKKILPTLRSAKFTSAVLLPSKGVSTDLEDEITLAFTSLKELVKAADATNRPPLPEVNTAPAKSGRASRKARAKSSEDSVSSKEDEVPSHTAKDYRRAKFLLASPVLSNSGDFSPPMLTAQGFAIMDIKDTKMANSAMGNVFTSMMDTFSFETHFLWRMVDQGRVDQLTCALLTHSEFEHLPLTNIEAPFTEGRKFRYLFLVPDSRALAQERESHLGSRAHEEILGERAANLSKVDKTIRHGHNVFTPHAFAAWMANCAAYQASVYTNHWDGDASVPYATTNTFLFRTFYQCADLVTSGQARYYFKMLLGSPANILLWLTSVVDQATILVTRGVTDPIMINHVLSGDYDKIKSTKYYEACQLVYESFDKFNKVITGTDSPPTCLLVKNYEAEQTRKASDKEAKKKEKRGTTDSSSLVDHSGKKPKVSRGPGVSSSGQRRSGCPCHRKATRPNGFASYTPATARAITHDAPCSTLSPQNGRSQPSTAG